MLLEGSRLGRKAKASWRDWRPEVLMREMPQGEEPELHSRHSRDG